MSDTSGKVLITGASGALGSHVRLRLLQLGLTPLDFDLRVTPKIETGMDHVIHLAGINRATESELIDGNLELAKNLTAELGALDKKPKSLTFSNSTQANEGRTPYGRGKKASAEHLRVWCESHGVKFRDVVLPNLLGEFGKPDTNMVSTTIVSRLLTDSQMPHMSDDLFEVATLQSAAELVCDFDAKSSSIQTEMTSAQTLHTRAASILMAMNAGIDSQGDAIVDQALWRMLVSHGFDPLNAVSLIDAHVDDRGSFAEIRKTRSSDSQVSIIGFSNGATRGNHFHRYLVEDFYLVDGSIRVDFGRAWTSESKSFSVIMRPGERIRFPIGWWHRFTDLGNTSSHLLVISNRIFSPENPDTVPWSESTSS
jgi:UDP-2-acetamido-2,6-beta-L-arabino-hexul-4-ose reductase